MNELNPHIIKEALDKVCNSVSFSNSGRNIRLIRFLVQKALDGEFVKEHVVGFELFEKDYNPDERNSKVRVYMYKLRNKLNEYYASDGKNDLVQFIIPKGQYNLEFIEKEVVETKSKLKWLWAIPILIIAVSLSLYLGRSLSFNNLWTSFFNSNNETVCFISDQYMTTKKVDNWRLFTYILNVDDETDLDEFKSQVKDSSYVPAKFSYLSKMAPIAVHDLTKHFIKNDADFTVEIESEFKYDDLKNKNLVFIGQFSCLHQSETLFLDNSKVFKNTKGSFTYYTKNETINYFNKVSTDKTLDYAMVSYRKMDNGNNVIFFASNHDIGVIATVRNFTNKEWLKSFYKDFPNNAQSFNALFEVTGYKRTELDCKLKQIEFIELS